MARRETRGGTGVVWVCGASHGIGRALVERLAGDGRRVAASARSAEALASLERAHPDRVVAYPLDVTDREALHAVVAAIEAEQGVIEAAFLNAGVYELMPLAEFDPGLFERTMRVNFHGVLAGIEALLGPMGGRGRGQILLTGSVAGYRGLPRAAPYGASKAALINMAESLQPELARRGIRLRLINPGFVRTRLTDKNPFPMPARITPERAAGHMARALERGGFETTFPRRFTWPMKLLRCLPNRAFLALMRRIAP